jgi:nitrate/nitrite transport system ATP-binding protein
MALIELNNVTKAFDSNVILQGTNLTVNQGEFVSIIGYSGSGKTTLISLIAGLQKPTSGEAKFNGEVIMGTGLERGMVFQNYSLLPWLTVEENVALAVEAAFPAWGAEQRAAHVAKYVKMVNLSHAAKKFPKELSGGMRQRVSVARALSMEPKVLLLDEPLSALDALTRATLQDEISAIWEATRTTVIWITNDPDEALLLADRVIPLTPGPAAKLGPEILVPLPRPRDRKTIGASKEFKALRAELVDWLLAAKGAQQTTVTRRFPLPDILPEDLTTKNSLQFLQRRGPRRRYEVNAEEVEVTQA